MKTVLCLTTVSLLSTCLLAGNWILPQEPGQAVSSTASSLLYRAAAQDASAALAGYYNLAVAVDASNESQKAVNAGLKALKDASDDAARRKAEAELKTALEADYDARLDGYAEHLDKLEAELAKMKDQLQKRRMAKSEMVDLRLQVLKAEANDLGWPNEAGSRSLNGLLRNYSPAPGEVWPTGAAPLPTVPSTPIAPPALPGVRSSGGR